ncbi:hypothetical protein SmJEL517_g02986 [Synchytrium microbalum]|uniref:VPS10 domain-containing protein n=1 Tax=Synchytrium microbalum TaxID=1806994 RepID=A0A507C8K0_9FUNG|nr:uncharacterized protein SmJEL517_g02986 [Synchytrium microbalum]TPX34326.1 hypothetical protein SmJEL517_g02986 [Synchytrium microbalum]
MASFKLLYWMCWAYWMLIAVKANDQDNDKIRISAGPVEHTTSSLNEDVDRVTYFKESTTVLARTMSGKMYKSSDEGGKWERVLQDNGRIVMFGMHDSSITRAYFFNEKDEGFYTTDRMNSVKAMTLPALPNGLRVPLLDFHPEESDWLVFVGGGRDCPGSKCFTEVFTSKDYREWKPIETWAQKCVWSRDFGFAGTTIPKDAVYCASWKNKNGVVGQDALGLGFGDNVLQMVMIYADGTKKVLIDKNVVDYYVVDGILVVAVGDMTGIKLMVSVDGINFADTKFPPNVNVKHNAFTILESTTDSIFLDVSISSDYHREYGSLYRSNANGTFYSKLLDRTNRNEAGIVDFEKLQAIPGIVLTNIVANPEDVTSGSRKRIASRMSFDDGATWAGLKMPTKDANGNPIKCDADDGCYLHLHSHASIRDSESATGTIHSAESIPGVVLGVGNVGSRLMDYKSGNVYISREAGRSWTEIRRDAHRWAIGDHGAMIVMVNDEGPTDTLAYTYDFGTTWSEYKFTDKPIRLQTITTEPSATSLKFIIVGISKDGDTSLFQLDFTNVLPKQCTDSDFEKWSPHDTAGADRCFLGAEVEYTRRKADSKCFVGKEFTDLKRTIKTCACTEKDFECDAGYYREVVDGVAKCKVNGADFNQPKDCKAGTSYSAPSGFRKIGLSKCQGGVDLEKTKVDRPCGDAVKTPGGGVDVVITTFTFDDEMADYMYFNQSKTVLIRDYAGVVWKSPDQGKSWEHVMTDVTRFSSMLLDTYRDSRAFFLTAGKKQYYTKDKGTTFSSFNVPTEANELGVPLLRTHPDEPNWWIWVGSEDCASLDYSSKCHTVAYVTWNQGDSWSKIETYVNNCDWGRHKVFKSPTKETIYCQAYTAKEGNQRRMNPRTHTLTLSRAKDGGRSWESRFRNTAGFAIFEEFMVAAVLHEDTRELLLYVTMDGNDWALTMFPPSFQMPDLGYTILQSTTGSIFIDVYMSNSVEGEFGSLFKSNYNGTMYSNIVKYTNRNSKGYVDFEKMQGVEGIAMVNTVTNPTDVSIGDAKKVQTQITFDDGSTWVDLIPPSTDSQGNAYDCKSSSCSLSLHSYTERRDSRDQFSASSAIGLMAGVGNVGKYLNKYTDGNTFLTRDGGRTWREVTKDAHMWEFGDHGGIMVLVNDEAPTDIIKYSLDEGLTFQDLKITDDGSKLRITHVITEPAGTTAHFILFGRRADGSLNFGASKTVAVHLDFSGAHDGRMCKLDTSNPEASDFEVWSPGPPGQNESCIFGHKVDYYRRKPSRPCNIGEAYLSVPLVSTNCICTESDFECDFNYVRDSKGSCTLVPGGVIPVSTCESDGYKYVSTGYRRRAKTTCTGGVDLATGEKIWCGTAGATAGAVIGYLLLSLTIAGTVGGGVWYYRKYGFTGGAIRLPDDFAASTARSSQHWAERTGLAVRYVALGALDGAYWTWDAARAGFDWVRARLTRGRGYQPVSAFEGAMDDGDEGLLYLDD